MVTFCTTTQAENKAGANASSAGKNLAEEFIEQAESTINTSCRYNFTANFSDLNSNVKKILEETASNLAAIYIISYDMTGYNQRIMAEDLINVLRDAALRNISILRDKKAQTFIENA